MSHWIDDLPYAQALERLASQPTVNIEGLVAGYTGPGGKTILPGRAVAKLDLRLVPNQTRDEAVKKLRAHLDKRGFSDVEVNVSGGYDPTETAEDSRIIRASWRPTSARESRRRSIRDWPAHGPAPCSLRRRCLCPLATSDSVTAPAHMRRTSTTWWIRRTPKSQASSRR